MLVGAHSAILAHKTTIWRCEGGSNSSGNQWDMSCWENATLLHPSTGSFWAAFSVVLHIIISVIKPQVPRTVISFPWTVQLWLGSPSFPALSSLSSTTVAWNFFPKYISLPTSPMLGSPLLGKSKLKYKLPTRLCSCQSEWIWNYQLGFFFPFSWIESWERAHSWPSLGPMPIPCIWRVRHAR